MVFKQLQVLVLGALYRAAGWPLRGVQAISANVRSELRPPETFYGISCSVLPKFGR